MAKIGYIMATLHYDRLEEDRRWMQEFGCVRIVEESDTDEKGRPLWKQLMIALERGDELVISKFSNALRGVRELAFFLEFCRVKVIRVISIHDRIDSSNELFPETRPSDVLVMIGSLPEEALVLRKSSEHVSRLQERMIVQLPPVSTSRERRMDREKTVINLYAAGHPIDEIWKASGFRSRSSVFRILNKYGIKLNRGRHSGPIKKWNERKKANNKEDGQ
jgi:DNA invertase Pin-like site-specific DNA recombinase